MSLAQLPSIPPLGKENRLRLALVVSVVLHLLAANLLPGLRLDSRPQGDSALQVSFRPLRQAAGVARPNVPRSEDLAADEVEILVARPPAPPRATTASAAPAAKMRDAPVPAVDARRVQPDARPTPAPVADRAGKPGEVQVMLLINENSRAEQILWDKLPSINDNQLRRIEKHLRSRLYPGRSGQAIAEFVDVIALLRTVDADERAVSDAR